MVNFEVAFVQVSLSVMGNHFLEWELFFDFMEDLSFSGKLIRATIMSLI